MGFLGKLFGSSKVIDAGIAGIDALSFTPQEKAKLHMDFLKHYEPFKLAQRYIALLFTGVFLFVYLNAIILWNIGVFTSDLEMQGFYMQVAFELAEWNTKTLGIVIAIITGFYFAGGTLNSFSKGKQ